MRFTTPSKTDLQAATSKIVPDIIDYDLKVLFCGINPSLYSAAIGHHFGRPGNRFWPALYAGGFTPRLYSPQEDHNLLKLGYGITNIVSRSTNAAAELSHDELITGGEILAKKVHRYKPQWLAVVGIEAYRKTFAVKNATVGPQDNHLGNAAIWLLPNPSGLNAHYTPARFGEVFRELRIASERQP